MWHVLQFVKNKWWIIRSFDKTGYADALAYAAVRPGTKVEYSWGLEV